MIIEREAFSGDPENDPYKHIDNFTTLCSSVKLNMLTDDEVKMILFPFSLRGKAKEWLRSQPEGCLKSWQGISNAFLNYYFSQKKIYDHRFDIMTFKQSNNEDLMQAYDRFLSLLHDCPPHNLPDWLLLHIFYGGLNPSSKGRLDIMSHGSLFEKTAEEAWQLLNKMHNNFHQWHGDIVHEEKLLPTDLESLVNEFFKDENSRGDFPYGDTIVRNVLSKAMPFIANHFHHIKIAATNYGEQPSTVTPISSTCCTIEAGKKGKTRKPKTKKPRV
jgi:hypothetical protein